MKKPAKAAAEKPAAKKPAAKKPAKAAAKKPARVADRVALTVQDGVLDAATTKKLRLALEAMLDVLGMTTAEVSLALVDDPTIRGLNKRWRKKDKPTDVLSFPLLAIPTAQIFEATRAVANIDVRVMLGDVVVSIPTATRQAKERKRPLFDELVTLVAHGLLHLLGFDHPGDDEEREMEAFARVLEASAHNKKALRLSLRAE